MLVQAKNGVKAAAGSTTATSGVRARTVVDSVQAVAAPGAGNQVISQIFELNAECSGPLTVKCKYIAEIVSFYLLTSSPALQVRT